MVLILKLRRIILALSVLFGALFLMRFALQPVHSAFSSSTPASVTEQIVLDAGHGGMDGGAVAADGTVESQINLQIVRRLQDLLVFFGRDVLLTRSGEEDISSPEATSIKEKKVSDLKNRVAFINETTPSLVISIHQNFLSGHPEVHGAQVFYHPTSPSQQIAVCVQQALNHTVNSSNKLSKPISSDIYLMKHIHCPAILVECGFLSNSSDTVKLRNDDHQKLLSAVITAGVLQYQSKEGAT